MVIWLTGKAGAGKTAVARKLARAIGDAVVLDGDEVRKWFPAGYTDEDRAANIDRIARIAALLENEGHVPIIACVSPRKEWRQEGRSLFQESALIYLAGGTLWEGTEYEEPDEEEL